MNDTNLCAPNKFDSKNNTCFSLEQLVEMANAFNRYYAKNKLNPNEINKINTEFINIKMDKFYLLSELKSRFDKICHGNEICLTKQKFMNEIVKEMTFDIAQNTFRPTGPKEPKEWLSTLDIESIMHQYENIYPKFKFLGAVPLDCDELSFCSLFKLNFDEHLKNNKEYLAVIFNLDKYGKPGSHWVALFIDFNIGEIDFCDSMGHKPIENINKIISDYKNFYRKKYNKDVIYKYNTKRFQKDGSECGVYSCNFIIRRLAGEPFEEIIKNSLTFEQINSCRNVYFSNKISNDKVHYLCDPT